eukprot:jgi/Mesen1/9078/ME000578S08320
MGLIEQLKEPDAQIDGSEEFQNGVASLVGMFPGLTPNAAVASLRQEMARHPEVSAALGELVEKFLTEGIPKAPPGAATPAAPDGAAGHGHVAGQAAPPAWGAHEGAGAGPAGTPGAVTLGVPGAAFGAGPSALDPFRVEHPPAGAGAAYGEWCLFKLCNEYRSVSMNDLKHALKASKGRMGPAHRAVKAELHRLSKLEEARKAVGTPPEAAPGVSVKGKEQVMEEEEPVATSHVKWPPGSLSRMRRPRPLRPAPETPCSFFQQEWAAIEQAYVGEQAEQDEATAQQLNTAEYDAEGQLIECGCCCSDWPFEEMAQCADGHLFCRGCVKRRVEESTFGGLQACGSLPCMDTGGCTESFPPSEPPSLATVTTAELRRFLRGTEGTAVGVVACSDGRAQRLPVFEVRPPRATEGAWERPPAGGVAQS